MNTLIANIKLSATSFWTQRDVRERKLLSLATGIIAVAITYGLLLAPALAARERLNKNLPVLREQVAQMQALSNQVSSTPKPITVASMSKEMLAATLLAHGLKADVNMSGDSAQLQFKAVPYSQLIGALDALQQSANLHVSTAKITALDKPDQVDANLTLYQINN